MCVARPARVAWIGAVSELSIPAGVTFESLSDGGPLAVDLVMVPEAQIGDRVLVHSGYAIRVLARSSEVEQRHQ